MQANMDRILSISILGILLAVTRAGGCVSQKEGVACAA